MTTVLDLLRRPGTPWWTRQFDAQSHLTRKVTAIYFVGHPPSSDPGLQIPESAQANHWTIYLATDDKRSVRLDATPGTDDKAVIALVTKNYAFTKNYCAYVPSSLLAETTVEGILEVILSRGHDKYIFHPLGIGCRFWVSTIARDLIESGIIPPEIADQLDAALPKYFADQNAEPVPRPVLAGQFY